MRTFSNYALLLAITAICMMTLSCAKDFQDDIDDLNNKYTNIDSRLSKLETQVNNMNAQLTQLSVLATAVEEGFYVTEVKTTADGYELTLNNGHKFVLSNGPGKTLTPAPVVSMVMINNVYYWTVNGMFITGSDGKPVRATGQTPIVKYDSITMQWLISIDAGVTFQQVNVYASVVINDVILMQVINEYLSRHSTTFLSEEVLFQIISTYIENNYRQLFNIDVLNIVISNYVENHYREIFNYELLD